MSITQEFSDEIYRLNRKIEAIEEELKTERDAFDSFLQMIIEIEEVTLFLIHLDCLELLQHIKTQAKEAMVERTEG